VPGRRGVAERGGARLGFGVERGECGSEGTASLRATRAIMAQTPTSGRSERRERELSVTDEKIRKSVTDEGLGVLGGRKFVPPAVARAQCSKAVSCTVV
jgi:hypothetical protein